MNHASKKLEVLIPELLDERTKQKQLKFKLSGSGRRRITFFPQGAKVALGMQN